MEERVLKAFVAGATGYTGREVVRKLVEKEIITYAHIRPDSPKLNFWQEKFSAIGAKIDTSAWEKEALRETFLKIKPDLIFCLIGTTRARMKQAKKQGKDPKQFSYMAVDYGLTALLINSAKEAQIKPKFVYLSALGVSPYSIGSYYKARWKAEQEVINSNLPYLIIRSSLIEGKDRDERRRAEELGAYLLKVVLAPAKLLGAKKLWQRYRPISNKELAEALVELALSRDIVNRIIRAEELKAS